MPDVRLPDGRIIKNVPDNITRSQLMARLEKSGASPVEALQPQQKQSAARTILEQGLQGATFGFADEITDVLGAGIAAGLTDEDFSTLLREARAKSQQRLQRQQEQRPIASTVSNIGGALLTGGAGASTGIGSKLFSNIAKGSKTARIVKGAGVGATSGAITGAGTAQEGERLEGAQEGATLGAAVGGAIPIAGDAVKRIINKKSRIPNANQLRQTAGKLYQEASEQGGVLKPEFTNEFIEEINKLTPQTKTGKQVAGDDAFSNLVKRVSELKGQPLPLADAQELDELLGDAIDNFVEAGRLKKQGKKILDIQSILRNNIAKANPQSVIGNKKGFDTLKKARKIWAASSRLADVERIIERAERTEQPATSIKAGFRTLLANPKRMRGFTKSERTAIKNAAETGVVTDVIRSFGSRLIPIVTAATTGSVGATATASAGSLASRGAATRLQLNRANKIAEAILEGTLERGTKQPDITTPLSVLVAGQQVGQQN